MVQSPITRLTPLNLVQQIGKSNVAASEDVEMEDAGAAKTAAVAPPMLLSREHRHPCLRHALRSELDAPAGHQMFTHQKHDRSHQSGWCTSQFFLTHTKRRCCRWHWQRSRDLHRPQLNAARETRQHPFKKCPIIPQINHFLLLSHPPFPLYSS